MIKKYYYNRDDEKNNENYSTNNNNYPKTLFWRAVYFIICPPLQANCPTISKLPAAQPRAILKWWAISL